MTSGYIITGEEEQTLDVGITFGRLLKQPALVLLQGDLGAGKTVLARGIARGLGIAEDVPITSPTFTLMNHYSARLNLYHFDLYRLNDPEELQEIGFDDFAFGDGVALIEWPEKMETSDIDGLWVCLSRLDEHRRRIKFTAKGAQYEVLLDDLFQSASFISKTIE